MPKIAEFYRIYLKDRASRGAHAAQALALQERLRCASEPIILAHLLL
jgi:hypothetical protein